MNKQEKIDYLKAIVSYAQRPYSVYNCLDCIGPGGGVFPRGSLDQEVTRLIEALEYVGLTAQEVDNAVESANIMERGGKLGLEEGCIGGCVDVDSFIEVVGSLLKEP